MNSAGDMTSIEAMGKREKTKKCLTSTMSLLHIRKTTSGNSRVSVVTTHFLIGENNSRLDISTQYWNSKFDRSNCSTYIRFIEKFLHDSGYFRWESIKLVVALATFNDLCELNRPAVSKKHNLTGRNEILEDLR